MYIWILLELLCWQASYGVEDAEYAVTQLAQTTMRSEIGRITMDNVFKERDALNQSIVGELLFIDWLIDWVNITC